MDGSRTIFWNGLQPNASFTKACDLLMIHSHQKPLAVPSIVEVIQFGTESGSSDSEPEHFLQSLLDAANSSGDDGPTFASSSSSGQSGQSDVYGLPALSNVDIMNQMI